MSTGRIAAVIPVKVLEDAKSRLGEVLSPAQRQGLVLEMLQHVLRMVAASRPHRMLVVTCDPEVASLAEAEGGDWIRDPADSLNESLAEVFRACWARGETPLYLPADLPRLQEDDVRAVQATGSAEATLVLSPSHDDKGTNALLVPATHPILPTLGAESFSRHLARARQLGIEARVLRSPGLGLDIDTPEDLLLLSGQPVLGTEVPAS